MILDNKDVFLTGGLRELTTSTLYSPTINTSQHAPVFSKPYPINPMHRKKTEELIQELIAAGIVEYANSSWQSSAFVIPKRDGSLRLLIDYRKLNELLDKDSTQSPKINEINWHMHGNTMFSALDAASGYFSIPITDPVSRSKLAFCLDGIAQLQPTRLPQIGRASCRERV